MLALLRDQNGREKAVDIGKTGWSANPVDGNEMYINLIFDDGFSTTISMNQYEQIKRAMIQSGDLIDLSDTEQLI